MNTLVLSTPAEPDMPLRPRVLISLLAWLPLASFADPVTMDFSAVAPFTNVGVYEQGGFQLTTNVGSVQINDFFTGANGNNAASPSFGFGQGLDSKFLFSQSAGLLFQVSSIDLLEATGAPRAFSIVATGWYADGSTASQLFTLDGQAGAQTFAFSSAFHDLTSLTLSEDPTNGIRTEDVQIDNLVATVASRVSVSTVPEPSSALLAGIGLAGLGALGRRRPRKARAAFDHP